MSDAALRWWRVVADGPTAPSVRDQTSPKNRAFSISAHRTNSAQIIFRLERSLNIHELERDLTLCDGYFLTLCNAAAVCDMSLALGRSCNAERQHAAVEKQTNGVLWTLDLHGCLYFVLTIKSLILCVLQLDMPTPRLYQVGPSS